MTSFIDAIRIDQYNKWRKDMKVNIWIHKNDIIKGLISEYYLTRPYVDRHDNFVQVSISVDEFARLEDKKIDIRSLLEREHKDFPKSQRKIVDFLPINRKDDQEYSQDNWDNADRVNGPNPNSLLKETGRSAANYTYPEFVKEHYGNDFH